MASIIRKSRSAFLAATNLAYFNTFFLMVQLIGTSLSFTALGQGGDQASSNASPACLSQGRGAEDSEDDLTEWFFDAAETLSSLKFAYLSNTKVFSIIDRLSEMMLKLRPLKREPLWYGRIQSEAETARLLKETKTLFATLVRQAEELPGSTESRQLMEILKRLAPDLGIED